MINFINTHSILCIIISTSLIFIILVMLFISFMYYTKRKFDAIEKYNKLMVDKLNSYKENKNQIIKNIEDAGISSKIVQKIFLHIIKFINNDKK